MKPMLAKTYRPGKRSGPAFPLFVQPKLNGVRALAQGTTLQSRDEQLWRPAILGHIMSELQQLYTTIPSHLRDVIFDGELYVHGWRLQRINSAIAVKRQEPTEDTYHVQYHIFDVVYPEASFGQRFLPWIEYIQNANLPHVKLVETVFAENIEAEAFWFKHYTGLGYEGTMLRPTGGYDFGRTPHGTERRSPSLWKHKSWEDDEFLCVGVTDGEGKASIGIGALVFQTKDGKDTFKVGTGFEDSDRIAFAKNPPIGQLGRIRYLELTADNKPFNASFIAIL